MAAQKHTEQRSLRTVRATRYVTPLREGGSLPGLIEADDDGLYVLKFRGAGQGSLALVAEIIAGETGRQLGLPVPELVLIEVDAQLAAAEPDPEIQMLIKASIGLNLGVDFLPGAFPFAPPVDPSFAADVVWFDSLFTNVDRTVKNPNILFWQGRFFLIDHGATLHSQHGSAGLASTALAPFPYIKQHILLPFAGSILEAQERMVPRLESGFEKSVELVPGDWFVQHPRNAYVEHLKTRLQNGQFAREAENAR